MDSFITRYSSAIVSLANDENKLLEYKKAIYELDYLFSSNKELKKYLESYFIKSEEKYEVIDELCSSYKLDNLSNFIKLITSKHVILKFHDLYLEINKQINAILGVDEGIVYSVDSLSDLQLKNIETAISKKRGHKVELKNKLDSSLIGGVRVVVHDHIYDGSIKGKLENLKTALNERRITNEN